MFWRAGIAMLALLAFMPVAVATEADDVRAQLKPLVLKEAKANGLSPQLVAAIITVESSWNPWAVNLEASYRYVLNVALHAHETRVSTETERELQHFSWGLMQIVGGTARAIGYHGPLTMLLDPATNIAWGTRYLGQLKGRYPAMRDTIAAYNAGSVRRTAAGAYVNQGYVDKVTAVLARSGKAP